MFRLSLWQHPLSGAHALNLTNSISIFIVCQEKYEIYYKISLIITPWSKKRVDIVIISLDVDKIYETALY